MPADDIRKQFQSRGGLQKYLLRFANAFLWQVAQNAVCSRFHPIDARLSRWLLMIHDRSAFAEIGNASGSIARALGADDREIEQALARLTTSRAIRQRHHVVDVASPEKLELTACECYDSIRQVYQRSFA